MNTPKAVGGGFNYVTELSLSLTDLGMGKHTRGKMLKNVSSSTSLQTAEVQLFAGTMSSYLILEKPQDFSSGRRSG